MTIEIIFAVIFSLGLIGLVFMKLNTGSKKVDEYKNEDVIEEKSEKIEEVSENEAEREEEKKEEQNIKYIRVGGIIARDYVSEVKEKQQTEEEKKEEQVEERRKTLGVFSDMTDYTLFYGDDEGESGWSKEEDFESQSDRNEGGSGGEVIKEKKEVEKELKKEQRKRAQRMYEEKRRMEQERHYQTALVM